MAVNLVRSTRLFPGAPYAYAAKASGDVLIFTAGACPLDEQGQVVALGDVSAQMRQALRNLRIALEESGATIRDVLKTTVYVASSDRRDLVTAWDEVAGFFGDHDAPSTLLGVAVLGYPGQLVEIEAIAVAPSHLAPHRAWETRCGAGGAGTGDLVVRARLEDSTPGRPHLRCPRCRLVACDPGRHPAGQGGCAASALFMNALISRPGIARSRSSGRRDNTRPRPPRPGRCSRG